MTSILMLKLFGSGIAFAVLFFVLSLASTTTYAVGDFCEKLCSYSLLFSTLCSIGFVLMEIWK